MVLVSKIPLDLQPITITHISSDVALCMSVCLCSQHAPQAAAQCAMWGEEGNLPTSSQAWHSPMESKEKPFHCCCPHALAVLLGSRERLVQRQNREGGGQKGGDGACVCYAGGARAGVCPYVVQYWCQRAGKQDKHVANLSVPRCAPACQASGSSLELHVLQGHCSQHLLTLTMTQHSLEIAGANCNVQACWAEPQSFVSQAAIHCGPLGLVLHLVPPLAILLQYGSLSETGQEMGYKNVPAQSVRVDFGKQILLSSPFTRSTVPTDKHTMSI